MADFGETKSDFRAFTVSAPGKLILFGEHSVVYGKSALAASINKRTYLTFTEHKSHSTGQKLNIIMKAIDFDVCIRLEDIVNVIKEEIPVRNNVKTVDPDDIEHDKFVSVVEGYTNKYFANRVGNLTKQQRSSFIVFLYILHGLFYKVNITDDYSPFSVPVTIDITTELSVGAGTGSSASFCVCIAVALFHYRRLKGKGQHALSGDNRTFREEELKVISKWALCGEKIFHGRPSGIDNFVATFGSFVEVENVLDQKTNQLIKTFINVKNPPKIAILLINTGVLRNTLEMVSKAGKLKRDHSTTVDLILEAMHKISVEATGIIKRMGVGQTETNDAADFISLQNLVSMNQGQLYSLGVSHPCLQEICLICSRHGLHAKLTGAGGGGYAFAIVPPGFDKAKLDACTTQLNNSGYTIVDTELGSDGVRIES